MLKDSKGLLAYDYNGACAFYLGSVLITLVMQAMGGVVVTALAKSYPNISESGDFNTAFMIAVQLANAAFIYFYTRIKRRKFDFTFIRRDGDGKGVTARVIFVPVVAAFILMAGMYLPTVWYGYLTRAIGIPEGYGNVELSTPSSVVMIVIASVFFAPVFEETIYRGVLLHGLRREKTVAASALLTALAFMLMHMSPIQVVFQFALGALCGFVVLKAGRLLPAVLLHATANALALVMQMTPFGNVLDGCVLWLTHNIAAAVFITLLFFAAAFFALFVTVKYAFTPEDWHFHFRRKDTENDTNGGAEDVKSDADGADGKRASDGDDARVAAVSAARKTISRSDGTFKYFIGIGICALMLILNLVTAVVS